MKSAPPSRDRVVLCVGALLLVACSSSGDPTDSSLTPSCDGEGAGARAAQLGQERAPGGGRAPAAGSVLVRLVRTRNEEQVLDCVVRTESGSEAWVHHVGEMAELGCDSVGDVRESSCRRDGPASRPSRVHTRSRVEQSIGREFCKRGRLKEWLRKGLVAEEKSLSIRRPVSPAPAPAARTARCKHRKPGGSRCAGQKSSLQQ